MQSAVVDNSQLTFTQALACLHESFNAPGQLERPPSGANCEKGSVLQKQIVEEPLFDLGFDLSDSSSDDKCDDDEDEEEVIPPSPAAAAPLKSRLSLVRYGNGSQSAKSLVLPETQMSGTQPFNVASDAENRKVTFHLSSDDEGDELLIAASNWSINNGNMQLAKGLDCDAVERAAVALPVAMIQPNVHSTPSPQHFHSVNSSTPRKKLDGE